MQYGSTEKRWGVEFAVHILWQGEFNIRWQHLTLILLFALYSSVKKIVQMIGCLAMSLPSTRQIVTGYQKSIKDF